MANRFSDIAKQMGAKVNDEDKDEIEPKNVQQIQPVDEINVEKKSSSRQSNKASLKKPTPDTEIPTTRKTTAIPLVLDIAIKEVKERRNIVSKIKKAKKITEDDVVVEALELYFKKSENRSYLERAYEKLKYFEEGTAN